MSELEEVKTEIVAVKARLAKAEADGLPIDNPGVVALNNRLIRLYDKEARLQPPKSDLAEERPTKIRRVEGPVECNIRVRCLTRRVKDVTGEMLEIDGVAITMIERYSIAQNLSLYCRKCYSSLYDRISKM
jgi:hypothetical protein